MAKIQNSRGISVVPTGPRERANNIEEMLGSRRFPAEPETVPQHEVEASNLPVQHAFV